VEHLAVVSASTMCSAKSTRRVRLLLRIGSPTRRLQTGRPFRPCSRSLPRTRVQRESLANTPGGLDLVGDVHHAGYRAASCRVVASSPLSGAVDLAVVDERQPSASRVAAAARRPELSR
jgi:hypothetical protein